jgi:predicted ester cyclase
VLGCLPFGEQVSGGLGLALQPGRPRLPVHARHLLTSRQPLARDGDELAEMIAMSRDLFWDLSFAVEVGPITDGALVAARWIGRGSYKGGMQDATAPAGTPVSFSGHDVLRVQGGRFAEYWAISEAEHLLAQLQPDRA